MPLQYSGPKPLISAHGIDFDYNKEDKFVYLSIVAELIEALDHEYVGDRLYSYLLSGKPLESRQILDTIRKHDPRLDKEMEERRRTTQREIEEEIERARTNKVLCNEEKEVLINNLEMLRHYRINRAVNKTVYYSGIASIATILKMGHVDYLSAPLYPKFMHVFHSLQGVLSKLHPPIDSKIELFAENTHISIRFKLLFRS